MAGNHGHPLDAPTGVGKPPQVYLGILKRWSPSLMRYGAFGGMIFLYFTDWQIFMDKVPFYNKKFEERERII